jgi:hypothetical protein
MNVIETVTNEEEQKPGAGPAPRALTEEELSRLPAGLPFDEIATRHLERPGVRRPMVHVG